MGPFKNPTCDTTMYSGYYEELQRQRLQNKLRILAFLIDNVCSKTFVIQMSYQQLIFMNKFIKTLFGHIKISFLSGLWYILSYHIQTPLLSFAIFNPNISWLSAKKSPSYVLPLFNEIIFCTNSSINCNISSCFKRFISHNQAIQLMGESCGWTKVTKSNNKEFLMFFIHHFKSLPALL